MSVLLSRTTLAHAVSGCAASMIAMTCTYPLDRVRTLKQVTDEEGSTITVVRRLWQAEGLRGLYSGLSPMLVALGASNFVYFYWFTALRALLQFATRSRARRRLGADAQLSDSIGPVGNLMLTTAAGAINVLLTTPIWVAYTKVAMQTVVLRKRPDARDTRDDGFSDDGTSLASSVVGGGGDDDDDDDDDECTDGDVLSLSDSDDCSDGSDARAPGKGGKGGKGTKGAKARQYSGVLDALVRIARDDGVATLWSGMAPSLILVSNPTVQFTSYETLKRRLLHLKMGQEPQSRDLMHIDDVMGDTTDQVVSEAIVGSEGSELSSLDYLLLGGFAKLIATLVTYPLQLAQTRLRVEATMEERERPKRARSALLSTFDCLHDIYAANGVAGLYRGIEAKILQTCLTSAFMFLAYERISSTILRLLLWRKFSKELK